ncbi:hypothetical protein H0X09_01415 [Candidatus Saccharibacteria bacterium]|nr:hypothetical protein [Candidatus Saccharibacteria bacterium]
MPDIEKLGSAEDEPTGDKLHELRSRAAEAVINANIDPSKLTPEEHQDVALLQNLANMATAEANLLGFSPRLPLN